MTSIYTYNKRIGSERKCITYKVHFLDGPLDLVEGLGGGKGVWGGEGIWVVPDSEKAKLNTVRNHQRATVIIVCFQNVSSSDVLLMKAIITLHPTNI